jgi:hypothetical protein
MHKGAKEVDSVDGL